MVVSSRSCICGASSYGGTLFLAAVFQLLYFPLSILSEETRQPIPDNYDGVEDSTVLFENCDIDTYYRNHRNGDWGWKRDEIASLLFETHRQVVPAGASSEFLSKEPSINKSKLSRQYAESTNTREALAELDKGTSLRDDNIPIETVHMIFTNTDIPVEDGLIMGWEPGYLWPMDDLMDSLSSVFEKEYQDEAIAAIHDLHNIRPRHPIVHFGHRTNDWYYDTCEDCKLEKNEITVEQRMDGGTNGTRPEWGDLNFDGEETQMNQDDIFDDSEGSDHLCVCNRKHALQPPEAARGEVARALLYMNLRYGTPIAGDGANRRLNSAYLDLALSDCHPLVRGDDYDDDSTIQRTENTIGYFSSLVKWHLEDPPNQRERNRNDVICRQYQGNRNPFVDFYEESWALLDFDRIERDDCGSNERSNGENDDDYGISRSSTSTEEPITDEEIEYTDKAAPEAATARRNDIFGCGELMPGDISFFMVQPSTASYGGTDLSQNENWEQESFGFVTLVDLQPGLILYVAGVDDDADGIVSEVDVEGGVLKLEVPEKGIPTGSYFGFGERMYLGSQWEPVLEDGLDRSEFLFSVHQLYLYCAVESDEIDDYAVNEEYRILAALSTTGRSFGNDGLPMYWKKFQDRHSDVKISEHFDDSRHYGLIILPKDASDSQTSGGYRYVGPTFTKHDLYAKALIDEAYWKRMNSLDGGEAIYVSAEDRPKTETNVVDISKPQPIVSGRLVDNINNDSSDNNSSGAPSRSTRNVRTYSVAFTAFILLCATLS